MPDKPRGYRLARAAKADLAAIWQYTLRNWSPEQADKYLRAITDACASLAAGDRTGRRAEAPRGYEKLPVGSHVIWFRRGEDRLEIVRVLHLRQDVDRNLPS